MTYTTSGQDYLFFPILTARTRSLVMWDEENGEQVRRLNFNKIGDIHACYVVFVLYPVSMLPNPAETLGQT